MATQMTPASPTVAEDPLLALAARISDGESPAPEALHADAATPAQRLLLDNLAAMARIAPAILARDSEPPSRQSRFEWKRQLGRGGFGDVWQAHDRTLQRDVAIKRIRRGETSASGLSLVQEARALARVQHPNVLRVLAVEREDEDVLLITELLESESLSQRLAREGVFGIDELVSVGVQIASALQAIHRAGLLHNDVKPGNICRDRHGQWVLLDFGSARKEGGTHAARTLTPGCAAPELLAGAPPSVASDVYALGALLFRLASGREAEPEPGVAEQLRAARPDLPESLVATIAQAMDPLPDARPARIGAVQEGLLRLRLPGPPPRRWMSSLLGGIDALCADLESVFAGRRVHPHRLGSLLQLRQFLRQHRVFVASLLMLASGLLALSVYALHQAKLARAQAERAQAQATRAQAAVGFVEAVFRAADPMSGKHGGGSIGDLLDTAAAQIGPQLQGHADVRAPLQSLIANAWINLGEPGRAYPLYRDAISDLRTLDSPPLALAAALERGAAAAHRNGQRADALAWLKEAEALAPGRDDESLRIREGVLATRWFIASESGDQAGALSLAEAALELAGQASPEVRDALSSRALNRRATALTELGRHPQAGVDFERSYELAVAVYGENHYRALRARQALAWHHAAAGDPERALAELEPIAARIRELFGDRSHSYAGVLYDLASAYRAKGQWQRAVENYRAAASAYANSGAGHAVQVGRALLPAADLLVANGERTLARDLYAEVAHIWSESMAADAPSQVSLHYAMARNLYALGDYAGADAGNELALAYYRRLQPKSLDRARALELSARIAKARGDRERAATQWRAALALLDQVAPDKTQLRAKWQARADAG